MDVVSTPARFEVWLVNLDPTVGTEIRKTRPAVIVSPDEMNRPLRTAIIAPMTTTLRHWPTRVPIDFQGKSGEVAVDQMRAVDRSRLTRCLGAISTVEQDAVLAVLAAIFARE